MTTTDLDTLTDSPDGSSADPITAPDAVRSDRWYLSSAPIVRALVHLCVPISVAMIVGAVYNVVNAGFVGSLHDNTLLGADATATYVALMLAFVPVLTAAFCLEQLVRAEGASRRVMHALVGSTVLNLALDVSFVLVLPWGVGGVALGTGLADLVVVIYFAVWLTRRTVRSLRWV